MAPEFRGAQFWAASSFRTAVLTSGVLLAFLSASAATGLKRTDDRSKPDFALQDMNGRTVPLSAFKGRTVLVHFFATWCEPCREELPALNRFLQRSASHASVIAISVADADQRVKRFFEQTPVDFSVLLDRDRTVAKSWNASTLPTTYVLDANMRPVLVVEADFPWDTVDVEPATGKLINNKIGNNKITEPKTTSDYLKLKKEGNDAL
jgi:peroxiredoxin